MSDGGTSDRLLTRKDLAERLGVCPKTISRWQRRGILPAPARLPILRWHESAFEAWLRRR
jgi:predicted DNA-binding transcriptional regulator AlpA